MLDRSRPELIAEIIVDYTPSTEFDHRQFIERGNLFALVKSGKLPHPTSTKFDATKWTEALTGIEQPCERDTQLYAAALLIARERAAILGSISSKLANLSPEDAVNFVVGVGNVQAQVVIERSRRLLRREMQHDEVAYLGDTGRVSIQNIGGQKLNPDDVIDVTVDAFPNLLFHATDKERTDKTSDRQAALNSARQLAAVASIEHGLRRLWQEVLWEAFSIEDHPKHMAVRPTDETLSKLWLAWRRRSEALLFQHQNLEIGHAIARDQDVQRDPLLTRTITGLERRHGRAKTYLVGRARLNAFQQHGMLGALDQSYIRHFLDLELPRPKGSGLTFRDLLNVWWVLQDVGKLHRDDMGQRGLVAWSMVDRSMLRISMSRLADGVSIALGLTVEQCKAAIDVFTTDPSRLSDIFNNGAWGRPIIRSPAKDHGRIMLAALNAPNPILTAERWMKLTGFFDDAGIERGDVFERAVRGQVLDAMKANPVLSNVSVGHVTKNKDRPEQIDILIRIGSTLVVGEVKCLNTPFESQENYNHLTKLDSAADQAIRKTGWVKKHMQNTLAAAGVPEDDRQRDWTLVPLVILNTPYGCGLTLKDCPMTDHSWLTLVLGNASIAASGMFVRNAGSRIRSETLYRSEKDLEAKLTALVVQPPTLKTELERIAWETMHFPSSSGKPILIRSPVSSGFPTFA